MKTETPNAPIADVDRSPTSLPLPRVPANAAPSFYIGHNDRMEDTRIVAYAIRCHADLKIGDREFSGTVSLHEAVIMATFYEESNGSLKLSSSWPPGLNRLVPLTQDQLGVEIKRIRETFIIPRQGGGELNITAQYFGVEPSAQLIKLHEIMGKQMQAWAKVIETAKARLPEEEKVGVHPEIILSRACELITSRELSLVAGLADVAKDGLEDLVLPAALAPGEAIPLPIDKVMDNIDSIIDKANAAADAEPADPVDLLVERLLKGGLETSQANAVASMVDFTPGAKALADEEIVAILGTGNKAKLAAVRKALHS